MAEILGLRAGWVGGRGGSMHLYDKTSGNIGTQAIVAGNIPIPLNWLALIAVVYSLGYDPFTGPPGSFSLGVALGIMGWFTVLLLLLDRFRTRFADGTLSRVMQGMGVLLLITGLVMLFRS